MAISGGIKLFEKSKALFKDGATIAASTGDSAADFAISMNRNLRWDSVGSNDSTMETLTITFDSSKTFDRIFLVGMNAKDFKIFYDTSSDFANVTALDGTAAKIDVTNWTEDTAYFEFDEVTASSILIQIFNTQTANAEKYVTLAAVTSELGTFNGFPDVRPTIDANEKRAQVQSGKYITQKNFEVFEANLSSEHTDQTDITLMDTIYESQDPFLLWLCGGKYGTTNFSVNFKNWRLRDLYQVQTFGNIRTTFRSNVYLSSPITNISIAEEV